MLKLSVKICPAQGPHGVSGKAPDEPCIGALHACVRLPWVQCVARANFVEKQRQSAGRAVHRRIARARQAAVGAKRPRVRISWRNSGKAPDEPCIGALHARVGLPWVQCVARANFVEKQRQSAGRAVHRRIARARQSAMGAKRSACKFRGEAAARRRTCRKTPAIVMHEFTMPPWRCRNIGGGMRV